MSSIKALNILYLLLIQSIISHENHIHESSVTKIHECSDDHDKFVKGVNLHQINVPYKNHPYDHTTHESSDTSSTSSRRSMLDSSNTSPIRISAYYDPKSIMNLRTPAEIQHLKSVVGAIVNYYQNAINVIPVDGTYFMKRSCNYYYTVNSWINCADYDNKCQWATIPDDHFGEDVLYHYNNNDSATILPSGTGLISHNSIIHPNLNNTHNKTTTNAFIEISDF